MHDTSFDVTALVPRLPAIDPPRRFAPSFAPVRARTWPWIAVAIALAFGALSGPIDAHAFDQARVRASEAQVLLEQIGR